MTSATVFAAVMLEICRFAAGLALWPGVHNEDGLLSRHDGDVLSC